MARPKKNNAEYFTHDADMRNDVKIKALRRKFSHTGYAVWNYLLETLTDSDFFEVEWEEINIELLAADYDVSVSELTDIVEYCVKIGLLQRAGNKLVSQTHQQRFASLLANRERKRISDNQNAGKSNNGGVMASQNPVEIDEADANDSPKQHSKGEESKGEESKGEEKKGEIKYPYQDIANLWNSICVSLPKVQKLNDNRRAKIKCRCDEWGKSRETWIQTAEDIFKRVQASDFLTGRQSNKRAWTATFDWIFENGSNWIKVQEGNYDNDKGSGVQNGSKVTKVQLGVGEFINSKGIRTYGTSGQPVPPQAPPRPSEAHYWSETTNQWEKAI